MASSSQNGFRKSLLFYLKTNANLRLLFKLMQVSNYFCFKEFPFSVIEELEYEEEAEKFGKRHGTFIFDSSDVTTENMIIDEISKHLWVTVSFSIGLKEKNIASKLISKMVVCNIKYLELSNQQITLDELKFLVSDNLNHVDLTEVIAKDFNGQPLLIENVLQHLINISDFTYYFQIDFSSEFNYDSTKNMIEVLKKSKIQCISLFYIPEMFDIDAFFEFMKENLQTRFCLHYLESDLSDGYIQKLRAIIDDINFFGILGRQIIIDQSL